MLSYIISVFHIMKSSFQVSDIEDSNNKNNKNTPLSWKTNNRLNSSQYPDKHPLRNSSSILPKQIFFTVNLWDIISIKHPLQAIPVIIRQHPFGKELLNISQLISILKRLRKRLRIQFELLPFLSTLASFFGPVEQEGMGEEVTISYHFKGMRSQTTK